MLNTSKTEKIIKINDKNVKVLIEIGSGLFHAICGIYLKILSKVIS